LKALWAGLRNTQIFKYVSSSKELKDAYFT